jgi:hypothetical protein
MSTVRNPIVNIHVLNGLINKVVSTDLKAIFQHLAFEGLHKTRKINADGLVKIQIENFHKPKHSERNLNSQCKEDTSYYAHTKPVTRCNPSVGPGSSPIWSCLQCLFKSVCQHTRSYALHWNLVHCLTLWEEHRFRTSENRMLTKIYGREREEVTDSLRNLLKAPILNFRSALNVIKMIKSKRMIRSGYGGDDKCV